MNADLLIVGAGVRGAVHSALRAGLVPCALDLFCDRDLAAVARAQKIPPALYPDHVPQLAGAFSNTPWLYTGSLENHPNVVDELAAVRPLWGTTGVSLRAVRDPACLAAVLTSGGFPYPELVWDSAGLPTDGSWLIKPLRSGGGRGVQPYFGSIDPIFEPCYFQRRIDGEAMSALYVASSGDGRLLGVTGQLLGIPGQTYLYRGNIGPWPVSESDRHRIESLGSTVASAFSLAGLFGIDLVWCDGQPVTIEVNPRYTASVEVLELALRRTFLVEHRRACESHVGKFESNCPRADGGFGAILRAQSDATQHYPPPCEGGVRGGAFSDADHTKLDLWTRSPEPPPTPPSQGAECYRTSSRASAAVAPRIVAKAILYAERHVEIRDDLPLTPWCPERAFSIPPLADIPSRGARFAPGDPVVTVFATAENVNECAVRLEREVVRWTERLGLSNARNATSRG